MWCVEMHKIKAQLVHKLAISETNNEASLILIITMWWLGILKTHKI